MDAGETINDQTSAAAAAGVEEDDDDIQPEIDIGAENYENLANEFDPLVQGGGRETKSEEAMRLMLDPQYKDSTKSLWKGLFEPSLSNMPNIEILKIKYSGQEDRAYLEWYDALIISHRDYLQTSLNVPLAVPDLSKRISNFLAGKKSAKLGWRHQWILEYIKYREIAEKAEQENIDKAKAEAVLKRKLRLEARRNSAYIPDDAHPDNNAQPDGAHHNPHVPEG